MLDLTGYKLTFSDEFNTRSISWTGDGTTWQTARDEHRMDKAEVGFGVSSFLDPSSGYDPFNVSGGALTITAQRDKTPYGWNGSWESGLITTQGNFSQQYGYFEMRADLSNSPGAWDAFWLLPDNPNATGNPDGDKYWTENDIVEHYGNWDKGVYTWIHTNDEAKGYTDTGIYSEVAQADGYHTYGLKWTPKTLEYYVDGNLVGTRPTPSDYHQKMHVIANLAVEANGSQHGQNMTMKIDYVRVYSNDPNAVAVQQDAVSAPDGRDPGLYGAVTASSPSTPPSQTPIPPTAPITPVPPTTPTTPTAPTLPVNFEPGDLKVTLSGDHYLGAPKAEISVDGQVVGTFEVAADHKKGEWQDIIVKGNGRWPDGTDHDVRVKFLNDQWGGTAETDRNLWFKSAELNGAKVGTERMINSSGEWTDVRIEDVAITPAPTTPTATDDPVNAADDSYAAIEDAVLTVNAAQGVLANDTAADGGKAATAGTFTTAQGGSVKLNADGSFVYTPKANFFGSDSFGYTAKDADGDSDAGTVTFNVADVAETTTTPSTPPTPTTTGRPATTKTLTGTSSANSLTGTSGNDLINGGAGSDKISGKSGSDVLIGGAGKDSFTFDTKPGSTNVDTIVDFNVADDTIRLNDTVFTKLKYGQLLSGSFVTGEKALDSSDRIVYNDKTGALYYDADGTGSAAAVKFAMIENFAKLTAADFIVI